MRGHFNLALILLFASMMSCSRPAERLESFSPVSTGVGESHEHRPGPREEGGNLAAPARGTTVIGERYRLYVPPTGSGSRFGSSRRATKRPLLVLIHGCDQNAESMQAGTNMDAEARRLGFFVLYPDQQKNRNKYNCWRWFDPANRRPNSGELGEILAMLDEVAKSHPVDLAKVYVSGLSSGGATAVALMACHPDRFQGAAFVSSPAFDVANTEVGALAVMRFGPPPFHQPFGTTCSPQLKNQRLLVIHGTDDDVVNPRHSIVLVNQFAFLGFTESARQLKLDSMGHLPTEVKCYDSKEADSEACLVRVKGLKHSWAGGLEQNYFEPKAFSATELISKFLIQKEEPFAASAVELMGSGTEFEQ